MVLLFIGPSGSGKDTQAELLVKYFSYERVSTGDLIREIAEGNHKIHNLLNARMNDGFMADNFVFGLLEVYLADIKTEKIVLSGAVRKESQIHLLDYTLTQTNKRLDKVIYFDISDEEAVSRMSGRVKCTKCSTNFHLISNPPKIQGICDVCGGTLEQREDDNPDSVKRRLADFHKDNTEICDEYERRGILIKIDGSQSIESIHQELITKLELN